MRAHCSARSVVRRLALTAAALSVSACRDGLFVEPATSPAEVLVSYSLSEAAQLVAGGAEGAFDAADGLRIRIVHDESTAIDTLLAFVSAGETRVALTVPPSAAEENVTVEVVLTRAAEALFHGRESVTLSRGTTNPVTVTLDPVPHSIALDRTVTRVGLGDTLYMAGSPLFATGHVIPSASLSWFAAPGELVQLDATTGRLIGVAEGATRVTGSFAGVEDTLTITIRSEVESVEVELPEELDVEGVAAAEARVLDRRGNVLTRTVEWSSSDEAVAAVDASGSVRGIAEGTATITGTVEGRSGTALVRVRACVAAPPPLGESSFRVSGAVARASGRNVDVVLNPILVNGSPVAGLAEENFVVVEDGCRRPFTITTSDGAVGIDLVFIQDLSGSMSGAINGVRTSVVSFAEQLEARGLDVRIGAVGYSGPSSIPSTPAGSASEYIGPVQDLTTPLAFQEHVNAQWYATGGGDAPENGLEAIEYAHHNLSWRPGATRVMILITDISLHWSGSGCGCSDQTIESVAALIGGSTVVHAVAPASEATRTYPNGVDPWHLAAATGGAQLELGAGGVVDLNALEIEAVLAETIRLTFESASAENVQHDLRVRVTLPGGDAAEFVSEGIRYAPLEMELRAARMR